MTQILELACAVLTAAEPEDKTAAAHRMSQMWQAQKVVPLSALNALPDRPSRPKRPELVSPKQLKRRRLGTQAGRAALLHAVAHIEFNAIDLAADMIARFSLAPELSAADRASFISDWVSVCDDEARHFAMVNRRLMQLDCHYGALPAHDGLWQAAEATKGSIIARLVIAPMVLEARGLDVTPAMITKLRSVSDNDSADILQIIYDDEIGHVAAGARWFHAICAAQSLTPIDTFHSTVRRYFKGLLKPPFNRAARDLAGMPLDYYEPMAQLPEL